MARSARNQGRIETARSRDDKAVGRIGVKGARQAHAVDRDRGFDGRQKNARQSQRIVDPRPDLAPEPEPALLHQHGDFPRRDRRNRGAICPHGFYDCAARGLAETPVIPNDPDQDVRVQNDHRLAFQSSGSAAGRNGSS